MTQVWDTIDFFFSLLSIYCISTIKFCSSLWNNVYFKWSGILLVLIIYLRAHGIKKCKLKILKFPTLPHCLFPLLATVSPRWKERQEQMGGRLHSKLEGGDWKTRAEEGEIGVKSSACLCFTSVICLCSGQGVLRRPELTPQSFGCSTPLWAVLGEGRGAGQKWISQQNDEESRGSAAWAVLYLQLFPTELNKS